MSDKKVNCPDCDTSLSRRTFVQAAGTAAVLGAAASFLRPSSAWGAEESSAEGAVERFYKSLSEEQKKAVCFKWDDPLRARISANWHITKPKVGDDFYNKDQQALIHEIVKNVTSEDGYQRLQEQMEYDDGGIAFYSGAVFGEPGSDKFQFELTGRHLTLRADGNRTDKTGFGGPIVYGHGEESAPDNLFHYQTKAVNEVFGGLDAKQRQQALIAKAPGESEVKIQGASGKFPGVAIGELSADQKALVEKTLKTLLAPYRQADVDEVFAILKESGGLDKLHLAFYQQGDLESDKVWDIWRVEGPAFVWHFRGAPHVHAYINIGQVG